MKKSSKLFLKYFKRHKKIIKRFGIPLVAGVFLFLLGTRVQLINSERKQPSNIVWAIDSTVKIPTGLRKMLLSQNICKDYRGNNSPPGVGLWGVVQVEQQSFAKIAHGCSWTVSSQILAVKQKNTWVLIPPIEYYSDTVAGVPNCAAIVKHKVPISLEGFCLNDAGKLTKNPNPN